MASDLTHEFRKIISCFFILYACNVLAVEKNSVPLGPVISGVWEIKDKRWNKWAEELIRKNHSIDTEVSLVRMKMIPFYSSEHRNVNFIEAVPSSSEGAYYLIVIFDKSELNGKSILLSGYSDPIHALNKAIGFSIDTSDSALAYIKFFSSAILGKQDVYWIIDPDAKSKEINIDSFDAVPARSLKIEAFNNADWKITGSVVHDNTLYDVEFILQQDGNVTMTNDITVQELPFCHRVSFENGRRFLTNCQSGVNIIGGTNNIMP